MLETCFALLTVALAFTLYLALAKVSLKTFPDSKQQRIFKIKTMLLLDGWLAYVSILSIAGVFTVAVLPPRIPLLLVAPAFLFFIYFFISGRFRTLIGHIPPSWPVYFQSFRIIVELLILGLFLRGALPKAATFEGYNFDIVIGITAPAVAYFTFTKGRLNKAVALLWNFVGLLTLLIVVFILLSHAYFYPQLNESKSILSF